MSIELPFASNALTTYVYEPFTYTIANPPVGTSTLTLSNVSSGIPAGYFTVSTSNVIFSAASNAMTGGTKPSFDVVAKDSGGTILATSSNRVNVNSGRFLDAPDGNGYEGAIFPFFKSEPITPIPLVAPFAIASPTTVPTLPPGLTYTSNDSNSYSITGTPLVVVPQSNYLVIGKATGSNLGKIVTSTIAISVGGERIQMNLNGSPIVGSMVVGTPISQRILTSAYPPYPSGGTLRYSWANLPDGIVVTDSSGNTKSSPFTPVDPSATLIIQGTPTVAAANSFRDANVTSNVVTFTATRTNPLPQLSNTLPVTFAFGETVLFDTPSVPSLYSGVSLDPSAIFFRAKTYFANTGSGISNIFSPDLRADLSLAYTPGSDRAYLFDISSAWATAPTGTASYTIRAINSNNTTRDLSVPITVASDVVSFGGPTPAIDVCYNFVLSRPSSLALTGYYPSSIQFQASAASGRPVTFSVSGLTGSGLSLSNVSSNTVQLVGTPEAVTALTTATVTASAVGTPATASRNFKFAILNDDISFSQPSLSALSFIQNRAIAPIQLSATTLSERSVISFTSTNLPSGLSISTTGLITGAPLVDVSGSFTVVASTGYASEANVYTYTLTPDTILFNVNPNIYFYSPGANVSIDIDAVSYSGTTVSNYTFSNFTQSYGLSLDVSSGLISGTLVNGLPPGVLLPSSSNFSVNVSAGLLDASLAVSMVTTNPVVHRAFLLNQSDLQITQGGDPGLYINDDDTLSNWSAVFPTLETITSFQKKNTSVDSNTYVLCVGPRVFRSTDGVNWDSNVNFPGAQYTSAYTSCNISNSSNWVIAGSAFDSNDNVIRVYLFTSDDDGQNWTIKDGRGLTMATRRSDTFQNWYALNGVAFASNSGVMLIGGGISSDEYFAGANTVMRSVDEGDSWSNVTSPFSAEVSTFNVDSPVWVMAGSDLYSLGANTGGGYFLPTRSLRWSSNQGATWTTATGDYPDVGTYEVAYASNTWLAAGMGIDDIYNISTRFVCSSDGKDWSNVTLPETFTQFQTTHLPEVGPIWSDGSNWKVFVKRNKTGTPQDNSCKIYTHSLSGDLTTGWTVDVSGIGPFSNGPNTLTGFNQNYVRLGQPTTVTFSFDSLPAGGPTVTGPSQRSFLFYQYAQIDPIQITATGTGTLYYFVETANLPIGISFDPQTATLSGRSVVLGQKSFNVYVKDDIGITPITISTNTVIPTVTRQQTSAGAWTSLIRQYTIVNAAQNSVNGKTLPATEPPLGEFMSPHPPDSVSSSGDPNCVKKC